LSQAKRVDAFALNSRSFYEEDGNSDGRNADGYSGYAQEEEEAPGRVFLGGKYRRGIKTFSSTPLQSFQQFVRNLGLNM